METVSDIPWGKIVAVAVTLLAIRLILKGGYALVSLARREARDRMTTGHLPDRWS
jgi:hypothetical protein